MGTLSTKRQKYLSMRETTRDYERATSFVCKGSLYCSVMHERKLCTMPKNRVYSISGWYDIVLTSLFFITRKMGSTSIPSHLHLFENYLLIERPDSTSFRWICTCWWASGVGGNTSSDFKNASSSGVLAIAESQEFPQGLALLIWNRIWGTPTIWMITLFKLIREKQTSNPMH